MKKSRGTGLVYQPTYVDKGTGERKAAFTWWIQYSVRGRRFRESSGSRNRTEAEKLLQERLEAAAQGNPVGPRAGKAIEPPQFRVYSLPLEELNVVVESMEHQAGRLASSLPTEPFSVV